MTRYHMNSKEKEITVRDELNGILKEGKYVTIAMCRDNEPYIVTLSYGYDVERNTLYSHTALKGLKLEFLSANPQVCATVIIDQGYVKNDCRHRYSSVVLWGKLEVITNLEEKNHAMEVLLRGLEEEPELLKERFIKNDSAYDSITMLRLEIAEITGKKAH
ncbi:MAG: pyridoxamine 5'-phosphate oxidase family protein [Vulcanimicrobiota bacterium]